MILLMFIDLHNDYKLRDRIMILIHSFFIVLENSDNEFSINCSSYILRIINIYLQINYLFIIIIEDLYTIIYYQCMVLNIIVIFINL
jgi:hypothetical protein